MPQNVDTNQTSEAKLMREVYSALNRNDTDAAIALFDPEVVRIEPEGFPGSGTFRGLVELRRIFENGRSSWAEGTCEPERFVVVGDRALAFVHVHVRLKDKTDWIDARIQDGFIFRNGKILHFQTFTETQVALDWLALEKA